MDDARGCIMSTLLVSRHKGALEWAKGAGGLPQDVEVRKHLDVGFGLVGIDHVVGVLPIDMICQLNEAGVRFSHLYMRIPAEMRGKELSAEQMVQFGAAWQEFRVTRV